MGKLTNNPVLQKMLERLFASLVNGPSLNARPHSSRQRIDFTLLARLKDRSPEDVLRELLGEKGQAKLAGKVPHAKGRAKRFGTVDASDQSISQEERAAIQAYNDQQGVFQKLRSIAEDSKAYENDTGVHVLQIGFPMLSLPPGSMGRGVARRVLAPIAFVSLMMSVKSGASPSVSFGCRNEGADLVVPNIALLAWLESQAQHDLKEPLDADQSAAEPWDEIAEIVGRVSRMLNISVPANFESGTALESSLSLVACPRSDQDESIPRIVSSAVIGLFPLANEGLIRDTQAILAGEEVSGPIESFVKLSASLEQPETAIDNATPAALEKRSRDFQDERLISSADPCQARAVRLARKCRGLVVHGPPGTGKSQTIANVIGDHLARGERVLFVCDKRTALDVVMNRLEGAGLGSMCAIVHDPQRDQRHLYRAIREQLDNLADLRVDQTAEARVRNLDAELAQLHQALGRYHSALMDRPEVASPSFHELMGRWLGLPANTAIELTDSKLAELSAEEVEGAALPIRELLNRAQVCEYPKNPWTGAVGVALADFLAVPMDQVRHRVHQSAESASKVDATIHEHIPPFAQDEDLAAAVSARAVLGEQLSQISGSGILHLQRWIKSPPKSLHQSAQALADRQPHLELIDTKVADVELQTAARSAPPTLPQINQQLSELNQYLASTKSFFGFLAFGSKKRALKVLTPFGLPLSAQSAQRVVDFLQRLKAQLLVRQVLAGWGDAEIADDELTSTAALHGLILKCLLNFEAAQSLKGLRPVLEAAVASRSLESLIDGLHRSAARASAITAFEAAIHGSGLFNLEWNKRASHHVRSGKTIREHVLSLQDRLGTLENVLRVQDGSRKLPEPLRDSISQLIKASVGAEDGLTAIIKSSLALAIKQRLRTDPQLQSVDSQRLQATFERYLELDAERKQATRDAILSLWGTKQRGRLLALTGTRLNGAGADLKRRLTLRGERAMRLRQVIAAGHGEADIDPLFDLRPVWMASPETVAQIFPREALFDVIVFDEASQCRLEEALPVLLRGDRVVIAGDPKQLPPSRFFESAVAVSESQDVEDDQQLFESQQGEIEDLLGAALNLEIEECYLDVHYRSRNSDLIEFSNEHFYGSRLQPIPGHPANRARYAPLTLYRVNGVYDDRQNEAEAERVCQIVRDLLRRAEPPSIGIACFNINQRDLIFEKLDDLAGADSEFAAALAEAWSRRSQGAFEGLFVKNLENVQGDERDHMIISTTYGPDPSGKFYRRFGPLGRAGGGRRLNVLVTRARDEVHLVTSIPPSEYRQLPPVPAGQTPGGPWLLFSYLNYAERLGAEYEQTHRILEQAEAEHRATLNIRPSQYPSQFCQVLGKQLTDCHNTGVDVFWGNDGFCVDLALQHPKRVEDVTIGVLCDANRFGLAADPVEWELFRTSILQGQGWKLHRLWTPHFFRDPRGAVEQILANVESFLATDVDPDAIRVRSPDSES